MADRGGLGGVLDLSDPLRAVYLALLRSDGITLEEMGDLPALAEVEDLRVHVMILVQQGRVERFQDQGAVKFRAAATRTTKKTVSDDIWKALDG